MNSLTLPCHGDTVSFVLNRTQCVSVLVNDKCVATRDAIGLYTPAVGHVVRANLYDGDMDHTTGLGWWLGQG